MGKPMIRRTYECNDCQAMFEVDCNSNDPDPECPACNMVLEWRPKGFAIGGSIEGKAVKYAQDVMENDYGLTNFKDNNRQGDVGFIDPTRKTAAKLDEIGQRESEAGREVIERMKAIDPALKPQVDGFFGGQTASIGQNRVPVTQLIAAGKMGPAAGVDPMAALHKMGKEGRLPTNYRIIARDKLS